MPEKAEIVKRMRDLYARMEDYNRRLKDAEAELQQFIDELPPTEGNLEEPPLDQDVQLWFEQIMTKQRALVAESRPLLAEAEQCVSEWGSHASWGELVEFRLPRG